MTEKLIRQINCPMECLKSLEMASDGHYTFVCPMETENKCHYENNPDELLEIVKTMCAFFAEAQR